MSKDSLEDETPGQYRYFLDSTGMLWEVPVCSGQYQFVFGTGMLWAVPVPWFINLQGKTRSGARKVAKESEKNRIVQE